MGELERFLFRQGIPIPLLNELVPHAQGLPYWPSFLLHCKKRINCTISKRTFSLDSSFDDEKMRHGKKKKKITNQISMNL